MKDLSSVLKKRREKRFWFFFVATVVVWLIPILLRPLVERTNGANQLIALVFVVLTALLVAYLAGQRGESVSAEMIPLGEAFRVLSKWPRPQNSNGMGSFRKALLIDSGGELGLFEFRGDMALLWEQFEEGQAIKFEEKFVQNDYDYDQDRYDLVVRIL